MVASIHSTICTLRYRTCHYLIMNLAVKDLSLIIQNLHVLSQESYTKSLIYIYSPWGYSYGDKEETSLGEHKTFLSGGAFCILSINPFEERTVKPNVFHETIVTTPSVCHG